MIQNFRRLCHLSSLATSFSFFIKQPSHAALQPNNLALSEEQKGMIFDNAKVANVLGIDEKFIYSTKLLPDEKKKVKVAVKFNPSFKIKEKKHNLQFIIARLNKHNIKDIDSCPEHCAIYIKENGILNFLMLTNILSSLSLQKISKIIDVDENYIRSVNFKSRCNTEVVLALRMAANFSHDFFWSQRLAEKMKSANIDYEFYLYPTEIVIKEKDIASFIELIAKDNKIDLADLGTDNPSSAQDRVMHRKM